ncbi:hypothetical protein DL93DRAFT_2064506 [Clavulina sp. PMI_390]|nr:hypothetical protein DL93DRAFT_2064506 [Clavulina sp. PMI_390]
MSAERDALWAAGVDETVEVNQRALIDKILARYSGENTVFRELLQNADDARSKTIEIRFTTAKSPSPPPTLDSQPYPIPHSQLPDLEKANITKWTFRNDGDRFRGEDWNRLKKIAEGNPDESKIGAFVRFYALFSVTESPFVTSGDEWMGFYWKDGKDQLYVRRGKLPDAPAQDSVWTTFEMDLRDPVPLQTKPLDLAKFVATSITFMTYIRQISVFVDDHRLFCVSKASGLDEPVTWPAKLKNESPMRYMRMSSASSKAVVITASVTRWVYAFGSDSTVAQEKQIAKAKPAQGFFASLKSSTFASFLSGTTTPPPPPDNRTPLQKLSDAEKLEVVERTVQLRIFTGEVGVKLPAKVASEIERATRKRSPANMTYQIVFTDKDGYDASVKEDASVDYADISVFQGVRADLDGNGSAKLFIGHATAQSTGIGGHHASRFIPTVEREALDLVDATVSIFNKELLAMGGVLSRVIYENEMQVIGQHWSKAVSDTDKTQVEERFTHLLKFFAFRHSTPSPLISHITKGAFLAASSTQGITLLSTAGVKPSTDVRRYDEELFGFLKTIPFLRPSISARAESLLATASTIAPIRAVDMRDILSELRSRPLDEEEMVKCLKWRLSIDPAVVRQNPQALTADFLSAATVFLPAGPTKTERVISLELIETYFQPGTGVIKDAPLPQHTLPISLSNALPVAKLASAFLWRPLTPAPWLRFLAVDGIDTIADDYKITSSTTFAERVLDTIAEAWEPPTSLMMTSMSSAMSSEEKSALKSTLAGVACIPTTLGMMTPSTAYFSNVNIFPDLPIVTLARAEKNGALQRMLKELGVRDHVELQLIFTRHISSGKWSIPDLIGYFVSIKDSLTKEEVDKLKKTKMFFAADNGKDGKGGSQRYLASQLHEPTAEHIALGVPVLEWNKGTWDSSSPPARFTLGLGLLKHPSIDTLIGIAASDDTQKREAALKYLLNHFDQHYRGSYVFQTHGRVAFIPAVLPDASHRLLPPVEVYANGECAVLGFSVLRADLRVESRKLQILDHPPPHQLVQKLVISPPSTPETQQKVFEYLAGQVANFEQSHFASLRNASFILIQRNEKPAFVKPSECYVGSGDNAMHSKLFAFVEPGSPKAQSFLVSCGVKPEPTPQQVADILLHDPQAFFSLAGNETTYLEELRHLATSVKHNRIDRRTQSIIRSAPIFLASKISTTSSTNNAAKQEDLDAEDDEMKIPTEVRLMKSSEAVIIDDLVRFRLFKESVWAAPQEDFLEEFYAAFGSKTISALVEESLSTSGEGNAVTAAQTRQLVIERLPLFLHDRVGKPTAFKFAWFKSDENFIVKSVKALTVQNVLKLGRQNITKNRRASAGAVWNGKGPVLLYIAPGSHDAKPDLVEVAHAICNVMFKQHTGNDSLLLSTILSTELRALKRIGYDVDRIIGAHKEAAERKRKEAIMRFDPPGPASPPINSSTPSLPSSAPAPNLEPRPPVPAPLSKGDTSVIKSSLDSWKQKLLPSKPSGSGSQAAPPAPGNRPSTGSSRDMTPLSNIDRNLDIALSACRKESGDRIDSRSQMQTVKEAENQGYCDSSADADIRFIKQIAGYRVWLQNGLDNPSSLIESKTASIERFANILTPLRDQVFKIGDSISIFYDVAGPLIAFNRKGSIFVNLRPFEQYHDQQVARGEYSDAMSFWYFTFGHEIAHNLVDVHNAEHEFYFSALCEKHLKSLALFL